ncbi:MCP four helix bundle domain-containing protein [Aureimonas sp. AU22]|uniref:MCP four helix bundle domain-containing protein n=1 Tax=Aureimonas sp. AU22 TaxID=1638162 RepID=UPI0007860CE1|nr:MCP four helix bundle domain-containing protein [Aureimonas sp. AU22]
MRVTIKTKLICSFGAVLALLGTAGYFGISSLGQSNDNMRDFVARPFEQTGRISELAVNLQSLGRNVNGLLMMTSDKAKADLRAAVETQVADASRQLQTYRDRVRASDTATLAKVDALAADLGTWRGSVVEVMELSQANGTVRANELMRDELAPNFQNLNAAMAALGTELATANGAPAPRDLLAGMRMDVAGLRFQVANLILQDDEAVLKSLSDDYR